jgi:general secretion pathway protein M
MKRRLVRLSPREKVLLIGGVAILLCSGLYAFTYRPLIDARQPVNSAIEAQQQLKTYLQSINAEVAELQATVGATPEVENLQSPISIIDVSSEEAGIKPAIKRLIPEGRDKVTLWLEKCEFDKLINWLARLDKDHAITVRQINIRREQGGAGIVSGKILLSS